MNAGGFDAIIFDHDGTLVDSEPITLSVVAGIAIEAGAPIYDDDVDRFVGADIRVVFDEVERRVGHGLPADIFEIFRTRQRQQIEAGLKAISGVPELLAGLSLPMAVASNAPVEKMELCLGATDLRRFFEADVLVSAYDVAESKPAPDVYLEAARRLGAEPTRCAAIEDSAPGVLGALAAGMTTFAYDPKGRLSHIEGATRFESMFDLPDLLV